MTFRHIFWWPVTCDLWPVTCDLWKKPAGINCGPGIICGPVQIHSSSQTQGRTTQSVNFTTVLRIPLKTLISLREKWLSQPQKGILVSWYHKLMGEFFGLLWRNVNAYRKDSKCFKIVQTNALSVKENTMLQNALLKMSLTRSPHSLSTTYLRLLHSGIYGWTFQALWTSAVIRNTATDRNRPIVYIWWSWKLIHNCLC